jgi:hypothetical protein
MNIQIATSIAPHNIEIQIKAVKSWIDLGFDVLSVNSSEEIKIIKDYFPDVVFKEIGRDAHNITGRPFVFLDDILSTLHSTGAEVCAILNSDIHLNVKPGFFDFLKTQLQGGLVFGSRIDVNSIDSREGEEYIGGFDYFFMSSSIIGSFQKTEFCLGVPWWDYWVPLFCILKGVPVKHLVTPVAYHVEHPIRWNSKYLKFFGDQFVHYLLATDLKYSLSDDLKNKIQLSHKYSDRDLLSFLINNYIHQNTEKIIYAENEHGKYEMENNINNYKLIVEKLNRCEQREKQILCYLEKRIVEIRTSISWRSTSPIRKICDIIMKK